MSLYSPFQEDSYILYLMFARIKIPNFPLVHIFFFSINT